VSFDLLETARERTAQKESLDCSLLALLFKLDLQVVRGESMGKQQVSYNVRIK